MNLKISKLRLILFMLLGLYIMHCGQAGTRVQNPPTVTTSSFPTSFAIASPLETTEATASVNALVTGTHLQLSEFSQTTTEISAILDGDILSDCVFDPSPLLREVTDADCYGPSVDYTNHPDGSIPNQGQLPHGDVGLWTENEDGTSEACAAAQQNARIDGVASKGDVVLKALASMICVSNVMGVDLPAAGESINLTADMTALSSTFSTATLSMTTEPESGDPVYNYQLEFSYTPIGQNPIAVEIALQHIATDTETSSAYRGRFKYQFDFPSVGNCGGSPDGSSVAGSILYQKNAATELTYDAAWAYFCGDVETVGDTAFDDDDLLDATGGWGDNYSRFLADFDPTTLAGDYAYAWQAGANDSHTRVFNMHIDEGAVITGDAFYGYGPSTDEPDAVGKISGFICNWAGPGNDNHNTLDLVQHQALEQDTSGVFIATTSNIRYAPTNSCNYTAPQTNQFVFDFDSDNDSVVDQNDPASDITHELQTATDSDEDGTLDVIAESGFTLPVISPASL